MIYSNSMIFIDFVGTNDFLSFSLGLETQLVVDRIDALVHDISSAQYQVCLCAWNGHTNIFHRWKRQQQQNTHTTK